MNASHTACKQYFLILQIMNTKLLLKNNTYLKSNAKYGTTYLKLAANVLDQYFIAKHVVL